MPISSATTSAAGNHIPPSTLARADEISEHHKNASQKLLGKEKSDVEKLLTRLPDEFKQIANFNDLKALMELKGIKSMTFAVVKEGKITSIYTVTAKDTNGEYKLEQSFQTKDSDYQAMHDVPKDMQQADLEMLVNIFSNTEAEHIFETVNSSDDVILPEIDYPVNDDYDKRVRQSSAAQPQPFTDNNDQQETVQTEVKQPWISEPKPASSPKPDSFAEQAILETIRRTAELEKQVRELTEQFARTYQPNETNSGENSRAVFEDMIFENGNLRKMTDAERASHQEKIAANLSTRNSAASPPETSSAKTSYNFSGIKMVGGKRNKMTNKDHEGIKKSAKKFARNIIDEVKDAQENTHISPGKPENHNNLSIFNKTHVEGSNITIKGKITQSS